MYRNTWLEVDLDALGQNIHTLQERSGKELIAVVKANAYGAGIRQTVRRCLQEGVSFFAVSSLEEALEVRSITTDAEVLILGPVDLHYLPLVREKRLSIITVNKDAFRDIADLTGVKIHLKLDTGMHRIGVLPEQAADLLQELKEKGASVEGLMTHYARSDEETDFTALQYSRFVNCLKSLDHSFRYIHTCNTDAALHLKDEVSTHVRCGLGLWGYSARNDGLKEAFALYACVTNSKLLPEGEPVSYGGHYFSDGKSHILTLPIGYADGIRRDYRGGRVYIEGEEAPIAGSICMDQLMLACKADHPAGAKAEFFGPHIPLYRMAEELGTIPYEILTGISDRVTREYTEHQERIAEEEPRFR